MGVSLDATGHEDDGAVIDGSAVTLGGAGDGGYTSGEDVVNKTAVS